MRTLAAQQSQRWSTAEKLVPRQEQGGFSGSRSLGHQGCQVRPVLRSPTEALSFSCCLLGGAPGLCPSSPSKQASNKHRRDCGTEGGWTGPSLPDLMALQGPLASAVSLPGSCLLTVLCVQGLWLLSVASLCLPRGPDTSACMHSKPSCPFF